SREEGSCAAAQADGADDPVLPASAVRRDSRTDRHPRRGDAVRRSEASAKAGAANDDEVKRSIGTAELGDRNTTSAAAGRAGVVLVALQHLPQIGDIGRRLVRRQVGLDDLLGLGKAALQA